MGIYLIALLLSLFFAFFSLKISNKFFKILFIVLSMLPFLLLSAFRYDVGTDYLRRYVNAYRIISLGGEIDSMELLFKSLIKICLLFSKTSDLLFIVTSIFTISGFYILFYKESKIIVLSILLFFSLGFYFQSLNLVRQYMAIVLVLSSFYNLKNDKIVFAFILYLISFFIHNSSFVTILYFFFYIFSKDKKNINVLFLICILFMVCLFRSYAANFLRMIISLTPFSRYLGSIFDINQFNIISFILHSIFLYLITIIKKNNKLNDKISNFYFYMQMCTLVFCSFSSIFSLFNRIMCYFSVFLLFSIPHYVSYVNIGRKKLMLYFIVLCISIFSLYNNNILHNYNEVIPYKSIFNKSR